MATILIALGSNQGDRHGQIAKALQVLKESDGLSSIRPSRLYETAPVGGPAGQDAFLNAVATAETSLSPHQTLDLLQEIEQRLGRVRHETWGPRTIDLDLLLHGDEVVESDRLTLPHPRMAFRRFVLEPAQDVAADMRHPLTGWTLAEHWRHLEQSLPLVAIEGPVFEDRHEFARRLAERLGLVRIEPPQGFRELLAERRPDVDHVQRTTEQIVGSLTRIMNTETWHLVDWSPWSYGFSPWRGIYDGLQQRQARPRLIVWLAPRAHFGSQSLKLADQRRGFHGLRDWGPVLYCANEDGWDEALRQAAAAIEGMTTPTGVMS
jgi:2-amino-4-hydroxy-6-hydroxymethyldihydropteridine diphosphokinase